MQSQDPSPTASTGSKRKKSKVASNKDKGGDLLEIKGAMEELAAALREGNVIIKYHYNPPIYGEEVWKLIKECGCDESLLPMIYCSLMQDIGKLKTILQCLVGARKDVIMHMMFGSSNPTAN